MGYCFSFLLEPYYSLSWAIFQKAYFTVSLSTILRFTIVWRTVEHSIVFHFCLFAFTFDFCIPKHCKLPSDPQSCRRGSIFGTGTTWRDGLNGNFFSSFFLGSLSAQFGWPISPQQFSELFFLHERISDSQRGHLDESSPFKNRLKGLLFFCS